MKKISISARTLAAPQADNWVQGGAVQHAAPTKRLTVDMPEELHGRFKSACAIRHLKMVEEINTLVARRLSEWRS